MKKKFVSIMTLMSMLSVAVLSGCGKSDAGAKAGSAGELYVYNWGEYIDESIIDEFQKETGIKGKNLFMPIRIAVSGEMHGPELPDTIFLLGREKSIQHIENMLKEISK